MPGDVASDLTGGAPASGALASGAPASGAPASGAPVSVQATLAQLLWSDPEVAIIVIDADQRIRYVNPTGAVLLAERGLALGERLSRMTEEISVDGAVLPPQQWPSVRALRGEVVSRQSLFLRLGEAQPRRMVISARPIPLDDGTDGALVLWHDVTAGWRLNERGLTDLSRLGQLLEGAADYAIIMLDAEGRVETWSAAAERIQGYSRQAALGLPYAAFFDASDQAAGLPEQILQEVAERGKIQIEGKRVRADGSMFWAHASITAMHDGEGALRGYVKVTHDVSERRAHERAVVELNELLEQRVAERTTQLEQQAADLAAVNAELEAFSYSVSHDLRAPLRAMSGFTRIIQQDYGDEIPPQALQYLAKVTENAQQMGDLIDALLSFSRMQRQNMQLAPIDMTDLVRECWTTLTPARGDRRIDFALDHLPQASGDRQLIRQVWMNLLDNAIKYTGRRDVAKVEVRVEASDDDGTVMYLVRDNGAGFDMRYAEKIGQVFQRLHHRDEFPGTGIGVALAQRIVQRHGGRLSAVGEPDTGATFRFCLRAAR